VVVDADGALRGWVARRALDRPGRVCDFVHRFAGTAELGDSLKRGFSEIVQHDVRWMPVLDGRRYVGVLTPDAVHAALRRTVPDSEREPTPEPAGRR
jgi:osmoprotectant transport system ATP-binding protein